MEDKGWKTAKKVRETKTEREGGEREGRDGDTHTQSKEAKNELRLGNLNGKL